MHRYRSSILIFLITFIVLLIIASSACLALDVPRLDQEGELKRWLDILNYWFTGFFIMEMMLKIVAYGFACTPNAYLKSGWNILDFIIVMISILGLFADSITTDHISPAGNIKVQSPAGAYLNSKQVGAQAPAAAPALNSKQRREAEHKAAAAADKGPGYVAPPPPADPTAAPRGPRRRGRPPSHVWTHGPERGAASRAGDL